MTGGLVSAPPGATLRGGARHAVRASVIGGLLVLALLLPGGVATVSTGSAPASAAPVTREAPADAPSVAAARGAFGWPLRPRPRIDRRFDKPERDWLPGHRGVDLAGMPGQPVLAAGDGIVVFAGTVAGKRVVSVDHPGGLRTTYEPVQPAVTVGHRVTRGTVLGTLEAGHPGCHAPACLHWGLRREAGRRGRPEYLDPLGLLHLAPLRLLPLDGTRAPP